MKIAFLIAGHAEPEILRRIVLASRSPWVEFFVHIDRKVQIEPFRAALADIDDVTFLERRVAVHWGGWSQVAATLELIFAARASGVEFGYYALLSGACYPVRSNEELRDFLASDAAEYISSLPMPNVESQKEMSRVTRWHFEGGDRASGPKARAIRFVNRLVHKLPPRDLTRLGDYVLHAGSNWWVLSSRAIDLICDAYVENPNLVRLFKYSRMPDESFFHTIIASSPLAPRMRKSLTFADWTRPVERPCFIDESHVRNLRASNFVVEDEYGSGPIFFARKFGTRNMALLDRIDAERMR